MGRSHTYYDKDRHNVFSVLSRLTYLHRAHQGLQHGTECDLQQLVTLCRGSSQFNPRDKVYGIFGFLPPQIVTLITPNLAATTLEVYADFTRAIMKATKRLNILQTCRINYVQVKFPTWAPDLEADIGDHVFGIQRRILAGTDVDVEVVFSRDKCLLHTKGYILDTIDHLTPPQWPLSPLSSEHLVEAQVISSSSVNSRETVKTIFWQTLTGGHSERPSEVHSRILNLPWPESYESVEHLAGHLIEQGWSTESEQQDLLTFLQFRERAGPNFEIHGHHIKSFFNTASGAPELIPRETLRQVAANMKRRRLVVTKNGRLCLGVREAKPGDLITILPGCDVPLILRIRPSSRNPPEFIVVGYCIIHGLQGEQKHLSCYGTEQEIVLC